MNSSDNDKKDLSDLIRKAQAEAADRSSTRQAAAEQRSSTTKSLLLFGVLLILLVVCGIWLWNDLKPATRQQVTADLEHILLEARASIEAFKANSGRLPAALPNASLSSVDCLARKATGRAPGVWITVTVGNGKETRVITFYLGYC